MHAVDIWLVLLWKLWNQPLPVGKSTWKNTPWLLPLGLTSYIPSQSSSTTLIIVAVLCMCSADARRKAFSKCASHLTAVTMFYGTLIFMNLRRPTEESVEQRKMVAVLHHSDPYAESHDLQFEKQRCERGVQQSNHQGKRGAVTLKSIFLWYVTTCYKCPGIKVSSSKRTF